MLVHEFRPGRLVLGVAALALAALFAGDAAGAWPVAWYVVFPVLGGAFGLAAVASWVAYLLRRRSARRASSESTGAPASSSGSQAMR
ncbi:hypothetical protein ACIRQF_20380 [Streptomyces sp. NPDC101191]|uniref:hypothetical protein n=1 Tax=Streptomyces sp. NPDC101191 TaxID=3366126 RepID=UPI0038185097